MKKKTPRQVQDFRHGYAEGYREARHGEKELIGVSPSPEFSEGARLGLIDGAAHGPGVGVFAADVERAVTAFTKG